MKRIRISRKNTKDMLHCKGFQSVFSVCIRVRHHHTQGERVIQIIGMNDTYFVFQRTSSQTRLQES